MAVIFVVVRSLVKALVLLIAMVRANIRTNASVTVVATVTIMRFPADTFFVTAVDAATAVLFEASLITFSADVAASVSVLPSAFNLATVDTAVTSTLFAEDLISDKDAAAATLTVFGMIFGPAESVGNPPSGKSPTGANPGMILPTR